MSSLIATTCKSRLWSLFPPLSRSLVNRTATRPPPQMRGIELLPQPPRATVSRTEANHLHYSETISTPGDFLKAIGRSSETKVTTEDWATFWKTSGHDLRKLGLAVRDRRYILWCMEKFRQGYPVKEFAHEAKPKKTIRGWGPAVQNGKRIRSRRLKNKK